MSDAAVIATFGVGYVLSGLLVLSVSLGTFKPFMKLEPVKVRARRK